MVEAKTKLFAAGAVVATFAGLWIFSSFYLSWLLQLVPGGIFAAQVFKTSRYYDSARKWIQLALDNSDKLKGLGKWFSKLFPPSEDRESDKKKKKKQQKKKSKKKGKSKESDTEEEEASSSEEEEEAGNDESSKKNKDGLKKTPPESDAPVSSGSNSSSTPGTAYQRKCYANSPLAQDSITLASLTKPMPPEMPDSTGGMWGPLNPFQEPANAEDEPLPRWKLYLFYHVSYVLISGILYYVYNIVVAPGIVRSKIQEECITAPSDQCATWKETHHLWYAFSTTMAGVDPIGGVLFPIWYHYVYPVVTSDLFYRLLPIMLLVTLAISIGVLVAYGITNPDYVMEKAYEIKRAVLAWYSPKKKKKLV